MFCQILYGSSQILRQERVAIMTSKESLHFLIGCIEEALSKAIYRLTLLGS
jgi:hypothetical protein